MTLSFTSSFQNTTPRGDHFAAAEQNKTSLSSMINTAYKMATESLEAIKPIFHAAVSPVIARMDKITSMAKAGQLPWAQAGIGNDGTNRLVKAARRDARVLRARQSASYKLEIFVPTTG